MEARLLALIQAPLHVTGLWLPVYSSNPLLTGSLGAGLLLEPPAVARVYACQGEGGRCGVAVWSRGRLVGDVFSVVGEVERLTASMPRVPVSVEVELPVEIGKGYACSAIVALATAIGYTLVSGLTLEEAGRIAHMAEVRAGTGLGDVVSILYGRGLEVRYAAGGPGFARVESVPVSTSIVTAPLEGLMHTSQMHRMLGEKLYSIASKHLAPVLEKPSLDTFLQQARLFSIEAGFVSEGLREFLDGLVETGLARGWYVKKLVLVVVPAREESVEELASLLATKGFEPRRHKTSSAPLRVELYS